jgi:cytoskeletal protein CcmA (bactofilin family)
VAENKTLKSTQGVAMFEIGKKSTSETSSRQDAGQSRSEASMPRASSAVSRDAAVIGPSIHIDGDVRGEEDLLIEGEVSGTVQLKNNSLTIGPQGKVKADVYAHSIYVDGHLEGDLYGSERVHIRKSAEVRGNILSPRVSLEDGAKFRGSIEMDPQAVQNAVGGRSAAPKQVAPAPAKPAGASGAPSAKPDAPPAVKTGL